MDFLVYAELQSGNETAARQVIADVKAMPPMRDMYHGDSDPRFSNQEAFEASCGLELHHGPRRRPYRWSPARTEMIR